MLLQMSKLYTARYVLHDKESSTQAYMSLLPRHYYMLLQSANVWLQN